MTLTSKNKYYLYIIAIFAIIIFIVFIDYTFLFKKINNNRQNIETLRQEINILNKKIENISFIIYEKEKMNKIKAKLPKISNNQITPIDFLYNLEKQAEETNNDIKIQIQDNDSTQFNITLEGNSYSDLIYFIQKIEKLNYANIELSRVLKIIDKEGEKKDFKLKSNMIISLKQ